MSSNIGTDISFQFIASTIISMNYKYSIFIEISPILLFSSHKLEFLKMLKGENLTPTWFSLPLRVIISTEKSLS